MKKSLFILAVGGLLLSFASCSNDKTVEVNTTINDGNEISFRALEEPVKRAAGVDLPTNGFRVTAFQTGTATTPYFSNVDYIFNNESYTSASKSYWPKAYNLDFYAYSPIAETVVGSGMQIVPTSNGTTYDESSYNKFLVTPLNAVVPTNDQVDLVYGKAMNWGKQTGSEGQHDGTGGVSINFRHAESKVVVQLKNTNPNLYFTVKEVEIGYLAGSGVFEYPAGTDIETSGQSSTTLLYSYWTANVSHDGVYKLANTETTDFSTATAAQVGFEQILIPQTLSAATTYDKVGNEPDVNDPFHGAYIMVEYKVQNGDGGAYIVGNDGSQNDPEDPEYIRAIWPLTAIVWNPGYKYTYTVDLAGGGYYERNQDTDADLDPVLGGSEIMFATVTVDGWANSDVIIVNAGSSQTIEVESWYGSDPYRIIVNGLTSGSAIGASGDGNFTAEPTISDNGIVPASGIIEVTGALASSGSADVTSVVTITETGGRNTETIITIHQEGE